MLDEKRTGTSEPDQPGRVRSGSRFAPDEQPDARRGGVAQGHWRRRLTAHRRSFRTPPARARN